jgi:hypothetical protein
VSELLEQSASHGLGDGGRPIADLKLLVEALHSVLTVEGARNSWDAIGNSCRSR